MLNSAAAQPPGQETFFTLLVKFVGPSQGVFHEQEEFLYHNPDKVPAWSYRWEVAEEEVAGVSCPFCAMSMSDLRVLVRLNKDMAELLEEVRAFLAISLHSAKAMTSLTPPRRGLISHTCLWGRGFQRYRKSFRISHKPFYSQVIDKEW